MMEDLLGTSTSNEAAVAPTWVVRACDGIIRWTILVLAALMPIFFLPWSIEVVELNKQMLLILGATVAGMAWVGKMLAERKFEYRRSVVNVIVVLFLATYAASAIFSDNRYMSLVGDFGQEKAGLVTTVAMAIVYFVIINNIRKASEMTNLMMALIVGGFVTAVYGLLQGLGLYVLPFSFAKTASFNGVGTVAVMAIYLAFVVTLAGGMMLMSHGEKQELTGRAKKLALARTIFIAVTAGIALVVIALADYFMINVALLVASAIMIAFAFWHAKSMKGLGGVMLPIAAFVLALMLVLFNLPVRLGYPAEVSPSMKATWEITYKTLRESPFLGSGPGTFIYDYAKYHSADVNATQFWNIRFDRGQSRFLTMVATTGLLGAVSWLLVAVFLLISAARKLLKSDEQTWHLIIGVFAAWLMLVLAKFLYSSTLALEFATWVTMGLLVIVHRRDFFSVKFENSPRAAMTLSFVFILGLVLALTGLVVEGQRYAAEVRYAEAIRVDQAGGEIDTVITNLAKAADLNKANDVYIRNLSLALLAKANKEASTLVKLEKTEGETDEQLKTREEQAKNDKVRLVAQLAANAVNVAKSATDISAANVANWSVLGSVYTSLFGVTEGADEWAIKAYEKAIELEPNNPSHRTERGKVYLYQAGMAAEKAQAAKDEEKTKAEKERDDLLAKAADDFNEAIKVKGDYAPAIYQLSLTIDAQGKLKDAITKMEQVSRLDNTDVGVAFQLALMYYRDGRKDDAMSLMNAIVQYSPNFSNARWYLAAMYEEKGDGASLDKAIEHIKKVNELNPNTEAVMKKLTDLQAKKSGAAAPAPAAGEQLPAPVEQPVQNQNQPGVKPR